MTGLAQVVTTLRALCDETRLRILHVLWRSQPERLSVGEIVIVLRRPQPAISRHLAYLRSNGLVGRHQVGRERRYGLATDQPSDHATLLRALEVLVPDTPTAQRDLERLGELQSGLTTPRSGATHALHGRTDPSTRDREESAMTEVLGALSHPTRRKLLDDISLRAGATLGEIAVAYPTSRAAIGKHLAVLERAGLVVSLREAGRRRLYVNRVPIQLVYDRWTTRFAAPLSQHVARLKTQVEGAAR